MSILSGLRQSMFTMILLAHANLADPSDYLVKGGENMPAKRNKVKRDPVVEAYNACERRFDPLGSYTGKCRPDAPCQDADDL